MRQATSDGDSSGGGSGDGSGATNGGENYVWQMEQMFSPTDRATALTHREDAPYLATIIDGRAVIADYGIDNGDGTWRLASGIDVLDGDGVVIAAPTRADILAMAVVQESGGGSGDGSEATNGGEIKEWRVESLGFNALADLPVDEMGVYLIDGKVVDYSIAVTDADGTFHVWSRNLDRALELQHKLGRPGEYNLRNYEIDFDTLDEVGSTDDSAYRVEILTAGQFHFASSIFGVDFQPEIMSAITDPVSGVLSYSVGSFNGVEASQVNDDGSYLSVIDPAIELFDGLMQNYIDVSRGFAVRLALQGGLSRFARGLNYEAASDEFTSTTDRELAPMFEAIFEEAPAGSDEAYDYLVAWREIMEVVYPDYHLDATQNFVTGTLELNQEFVFQMLLPAFENIGIDADLASVMNALGVDETRLIAHDATATVVDGTDGDDYIYLSAGNQTLRGSYGQDTYFVGKGFGQDIKTATLAILLKAENDNTCHLLDVA